MDPSGLRLTAEHIVDLCDPIFAEHATTADAERAMIDIVAVLEQALVEETQELRSALDEMVKNHRYRFPLAGTCQCPACQKAATLIGGRN